MTIQNEMLVKFESILGEVKPPLKFKLINNIQEAIKFANNDLWSWDLSEEIVSQGLDQNPIGYLFFGLLLNNEPAGITVFKRYNPDIQKDIPILSTNGSIQNSSAILTLQSLADFTRNKPVLELGDTYLKDFQSNKGLFTPFRYDLSLLNKYLRLAVAVHSYYPDDFLITMAHGIYDYNPELEKQITNVFGQNKNKLTVQEYLERFDNGQHYIPNAITKIGSVRGLSKITERMVISSRIPFNIIGYAPCDMGPVYLAYPQTVKDIAF